MPIVHIPTLMRDLTEGRAQVKVPGQTVRAAIEALELAYPGTKARLCSGERLAPTVAVAVDGRLSRLGLYHPVNDDSQVRFLPAIEGG